MSGNRFVAHVANITSRDEIATALSAIKFSFHAIATATHNMYGTRINVNNSIQEYSHDDGEHGGARAIMEVLRKQDVTNRLVVVTRWASGIQLSSKRFAIIAKCTDELIAPRQTRTDDQTAPQIAPQGATRMTAPQIAPQGATRMTAPQIADPPQGATRMTARHIAPQGTTRMTAPQITPQGTTRTLA